MSTLKVVFIGQNPSDKNHDPAVPFKGTKSGEILDSWRIALGLDESQCSFINAYKFPKKGLKKTDIDLKQFHFELSIKLIAATHGEEKAFSMVISAMQNKGTLDPAKLVPNTPEEVEAHMKEIRSTPMPRIITLGSIADWAMSKTQIDYFKLPHPSGLNRVLNDKAYLSKLLEDCKKWLYTLPE